MLNVSSEHSFKKGDQAWIYHYLSWLTSTRMLSKRSSPNRSAAMIQKRCFLASSFAFFFFFMDTDNLNKKVTKRKQGNKKVMKQSMGWQNNYILYHYNQWTASLNRVLIKRTVDAERFFSVSISRGHLKNHLMLHNNHLNFNIVTIFLCNVYISSYSIHIVIVHL